MKRRRIASVDGVVDSGSRGRELEQLVPCHVPELSLQDMLDLVDAELPPGTEAVKGAWEEEVLVLIRGDDPLLEVNNKPVGSQEICPEDGLLDVSHLEIPLEPPALELEGEPSGIRSRRW